MAKRASLGVEDDRQVVGLLLFNNLYEAIGKAQKSTCIVSLAIESGGTNKGKVSSINEHTGIKKKKSFAGKGRVH